MERKSRPPGVTWVTVGMTVGMSGRGVIVVGMTGGKVAVGVMEIVVTVVGRMTIATATTAATATAVTTTAAAATAAWVATPTCATILPARQGVVCVIWVNQRMFIYGDI